MATAIRPTVAPANFRDLHPNLTLASCDGIEIVLWKDQTADAFYVPPLVPVAGTAGTGRFIGHQVSFDIS